MNFLPLNEKQKPDIRTHPHVYARADIFSLLIYNALCPT